MPTEQKTPVRPRGTIVNPESKKVKGTKLSPLWKDEYYIQAYELARQGLDDAAIASSLGVGRDTFWSWKRGNAALANALTKARDRLSKNGTEKFLDYVYGRLSPELVPIWREIMAVQEARSTTERVEAMLAKKGEYARKNLFIHAMVHYNFNPSYACTAVGVSKGLLEYWVGTDHRFGKLLDELHWHKKNLYEGKLVEKVIEGDTAAVIFVNKTINRDRGYGKEVKHVHVGSVEHVHTSAPVSQTVLNQLSPQAKRELLDAMRKQQDQQKLALGPAPASNSAPEVVEGEIIEEGDY